MAENIKRGNEIDMLFRSAVNMIAEERGGADLAREYVEVPSDESLRKLKRRLRKGGWSGKCGTAVAGKGRSAWHRRFATLAACAAALLICVTAITAPAWQHADSDKANGEEYRHLIEILDKGGGSQSVGSQDISAGNPTTVNIQRSIAESDLFKSMFVYADDTRYDFGLKNSVIIPAAELEYSLDDKDSVLLTEGIIGFENPKIHKLTYKCESGKLIHAWLATQTAPEQLSDDAKQLAENNQYVEFKYYDGYYREISWFGDSGDIFDELEGSAPDFSKVEPDILSISVTMDDASEYEIKVQMSYTNEGNVIVEIIEWNEL